MKNWRNLSTSMLECLRALNPDDEHYWNAAEDSRELPMNTMRALRRRGYVNGSEVEGWTINEWGLKAAKNYVQKTGNGPERLKQYLRF